MSDRKDYRLWSRVFFNRWNRYTIKG
jgi:hypothetical protein